MMKTFLALVFTMLALLGAPMSYAATVFTLTGATEPQYLMKSELGGEITNGNTVIPVGNGYTTTSSDAAALQSAMLKQPAGTNLVVFGNSKGAVSAEMWIKTYGPTSTLNPTFVLIGEPNRRYGGYAPTALNNYTNVIPADTRFTVYTLARQYDSWADYPNVKTSTYYNEAVITAKTLYLHGDYFSTSLYAANNLVYKQGNITYVLAPTTLSNATTQAQVEQAYNRPEKLTAAAQGITIPVFDPPVKAPATAVSAVSSPTVGNGIGVSTPTVASSGPSGAQQGGPVGAAQPGHPVVAETVSTAKTTVSTAKTTVSTHRAARQAHRSGK